MKKGLLVFLVVLVGTTVIFADDFGASVSAGANLAFLSADGATDALLSDRSPRFGLTVGVQGNYNFHSNKRQVQLSIQPGIFYTMKGYRIYASGGDMKANLDYLEIPILLKAGIPLKGSANPYFLVGPSIGIHVLNETIVETSGVTATVKNDKRNDFGLVIGAGAALDNGISIDLRANFGFINIDETTDDKNKNHSMALLVSYAIL